MDFQIPFFLMFLKWILRPIGLGYYDEELTEFIDAMTVAKERHVPETQFRWAERLVGDEYQDLESWRVEERWADVGFGSPSIWQHDDSGIRKKHL